MCICTFANTYSIILIITLSLVIKRSNILLITFTFLAGFVIAITLLASCFQLIVHILIIVTIIFIAFKCIVVSWKCQMSVMLTRWASNVFLYCLYITVFFAPITMASEKSRPQILTTFAETHQEVQITQVLDVHELTWCNV